MNSRINFANWKLKRKYGKFATNAMRKTIKHLKEISSFTINSHRIDKIYKVVLSSTRKIKNESFICYIASLPTYIVKLIIHHLDSVGKLSFLRVCKRFNKIIPRSGCFIPKIDVSPFNFIKKWGIFQIEKGCCLIQYNFGNFCRESYIYPFCKYNANESFSQYHVEITEESIPVLFFKNQQEYLECLDVWSKEFVVAEKLSDRKLRSIHNVVDVFKIPLTQTVCFYIIDSDKDTTNHKSYLCRCLKFYSETSINNTKSDGFYLADPYSVYLPSEI